MCESKKNEATRIEHNDCEKISKSEAVNAK